MSDRSRIVRARGGQWAGVVTTAYKESGPGYHGMTRRLLLAAEAGDESLPFDVRYFEIDPGGYSSLERHEHPHAVIVLRGRGHVILQDQARELAPLDCVYVAPNALHQFHATEDEPLGFLCIVDRERDRPVPATAADRERIGVNSTVARLLNQVENK